MLKHRTDPVVVKPAVTIDPKMADRIVKLNAQAKQIRGAVLELAEKAGNLMFELDTSLTGKGLSDAEHDWAREACGYAALDRVLSEMTAHLEAVTGSGITLTVPWRDHLRDEVRRRSTQG